MLLPLVQLARTITKKRVELKKKRRHVGSASSDDISSDDISSDDISSDVQAAYNSYYVYLVIVLIILVLNFVYFFYVIKWAIVAKKQGLIDDNYMFLVIGLTFVAGPVFGHLVLIWTRTDSVDKETLDDVDIVYNVGVRWPFRKKTGIFDNTDEQRANWKIAKKKLKKSIKFDDNVADSKRRTHRNNNIRKKTLTMDDIRNSNKRTLGNR
jgi:hypothetical protein